MSATRSINTALLESKKEESGCKSPWISLQFAYTLLNTFVKTGYTSAILITDTFSLEPIFLKMSWEGIAVSIPLAIFFSVCESYAHSAQGEHFDRTKNKTDEIDLELSTLSNNSDQNNENEPEPEPETGLTVRQKILTVGHFLSDFFEGVETPLFISKMAGIDNTAFWKKGVTYLGASVYSFFGNVQEFKNTVTAFEEENKQRRLRN